MGEVVVTEALIDRLAAVRSLFDELLSELENTAALIDTADLCTVADSVESLSRQAGYAQLIVARSIEEQVFIDQQSGVRSEFRNCAEFLQSRLRIGKGEARRRLKLAAAILPRRTLGGEVLEAGYRLLGSLAAHAVASLPALNIAIVALDTAAVKTMSNVEQITASEPEVDRQTALTARNQTLNTMEASLAEALTDHDPDFLTPLIRRWDTLIDQDGTVPDETELRHRQGLFRRETRRGLTRFELWADQLQTETLLTVVHAGNNPRAGNAEDRSLDSRSVQQRHLDALTGALSSALRHRDLPQSGGQAAQLSVTIDYASLAEQLAGQSIEEPIEQPIGQAAKGSVGRLANRQSKASLQFTGPIQARAVRRLACDAGLIPMVLAADGEVLDVGRKRRLFTVAQRAALVVRDKGCAFPGCTIPASWCEAHHIEPWQRGGLTSVANGVLLCSHHHHLIHLGDWHIEQSPVSAMPSMPPIATTPAMPQPPTNSGQSTTNSGRSTTQKRASPWFIPPRWIDPHQTPRQNQFHQL